MVSDRRARIVAPPGVALALGLALALGSACLLAQGPLPGDVAATRALQSLFGDAPDWAGRLTASARVPGLWATLLLATALAAVRGGPSAMLAPPLALVLAQLADRGLRALVFAPRPDALLVQVAAPGAGSGLPSTFALVFGALFGAVLFTSARSADERRSGSTAAAAAAAALILAGCSARVVLGGHWTSQVLASLALAFAIALLVHAAIEGVRARGEGPCAR